MPYFKNANISRCYCSEKTGAYFNYAQLQEYTGEKFHVIYRDIQDEIVIRALSAMIIQTSFCPPRNVNQDKRKPPSIPSPSYTRRFVTSMIRKTTSTTPLDASSIAICVYRGLLSLFVLKEEDKRFARREFS